MMKKVILTIFLVTLVLATLIVEVKATASTVTLTLGSNKNNPTQYPTDAYSLLTLNETMMYNYQGSVMNPTDGLVGVQIQDKNGNTMVIRTLQTGSTTPFGLADEITQAYLSDGYGNKLTSTPIPSASNEVQPYVYVYVQSNQDTTQTVLITLNVFDSNGIPFCATSEPATIGPNSYTAPIIPFQIPSWVHYGTAYAYIDVYNTWPSQGGYPQCEEFSSQFTITGGTAFQGIQPATQSLNGDPTDYFSISFRLPQYTDLTLGTCTAYSSTNYLGVAGSQTTTFNVAELADINGDGVVNFNDITTFVGLYINYFANHVYSPQIDFIHNGSVINFNDVALFVGYYILAWSS
jgi:hypothetical protein